MQLLLLHPLPFDGLIYSDQTRRLVQTCAAPTLYQHGTDIRAWAEAGLSTAGSGPLVVMGNSIGGSVAIEVARLAPDQVKALVLVGTKPGHRPEPNLRDEALRCLHRDGLRAAWERYWLPLFGPRTAPRTLERAWQTASEIGLDAIGAGVEAFHSRPDREDFLLSWPGPVWIVSGEQDIHPRPAPQLARRLPNGRFYLVPDSGHYVPLERPEVLHTIVAEALALACEE